MKLHTITFAKPLSAGRLQLFFDEGSAAVDLSPILARGGVFAPLCDIARFATVEVGPRGRTILWRLPTAAGEEEIVDLCADALWLMAHPEQPAADAEDRQTRL